MMAGRTPLSSEVFRQQVSFTLEQTNWLRGPGSHSQGFAAAVRQAVEDQRTMYSLPPVMVEGMNSEAKRLGLAALLSEYERRLALLSARDQTEHSR
jgi:hypothetical protein